MKETNNANKSSENLKIRLKDGNSIIEDVGEEDLRIIPFAVDNFLRSRFSPIRFLL